MSTSTNVKKLLIVEDDTAILEILGLIFSTEGYQVQLSETGAETYELETIRPDLILLDIRLSHFGNEGEMICERIKHAQHTAHIPVILLSAEADIHRICQSCGADSYVKKPFDVDHLTRKVKALIEK